MLLTPRSTYAIECNNICLRKFILKQSGAVLFVGLMMLLIMSLIAITGMQTSTLEVRMAGNTRDSLVALQTAEAALKAGETLLDTSVLNLTDFDTNGSDGLYDNSNDQLLSTLNWTAADSRSYAGFNPSNVETAPRYIIQHIAETNAAPNLIDKIMVKIKQDKLFSFIASLLEVLAVVITLK